MDEEEIVERGLIAYCIIYFSVNTMSGIVLDEKLKQIKRGLIEEMPPVRKEAEK